MKPSMLGRRIAVSLLLGFALLAGRPLTVAAEEEATAKMRELGKTLFDTRCVACHGKGGKGDGPAAAGLKSPPKDLTRIADRYDGTFPRKTIEQIIDGRQATLAHGSREMPVWGDLFFREASAILPETMVYALAEYIESIQQK